MELWHSSIDKSVLLFREEFIFHIFRLIWTFFDHFCDLATSQLKSELRNWLRIRFRRAKNLTSLIMELWHCIDKSVLLFREEFIFHIFRLFGPVLTIFVIWPPLSLLKNIEHVFQTKKNIFQNKKFPPPLLLDALYSETRENDLRFLTSHLRSWSKMTKCVLVFLT